MKRFLVGFLAGLGLMVGFLPHHTVAQARLSPLDQLKATKAANDKLLETQTATLQKLDDLLKDAQQVRAFARRT